MYISPQNRLIKFPSISLEYSVIFLLLELKLTTNSIRTEYPTIIKSSHTNTNTKHDTKTNNVVNSSSYKNSNFINIAHSLKNNPGNKSNNFRSCRTNREIPNQTRTQINPNNLDEDVV